MHTITIIGGGASGMLAAYSASIFNSARVLLLEKNAKTGKKLLITGKGRCNITNIGNTDVYMQNIAKNGAFLYSALSQFGNYDIISLLDENGLPTTVERGGRVFPKTGNAHDVAAVLRGLLKKASVKTGADVCKITKTRQFNITLKNGEIIKSDTVILATGGLSYPGTGSTGDGYKFAKNMGHTVTELYPSLSALNIKKPLSHMSGLSLKNIRITLKDMRGAVIYEDFGEMLFTHKGVSGPVVLSAAAKIAERAAREEFALVIDLKPALDVNALNKRILKDFEKYKNKDIQNALFDLLPKSIITGVIEKSGIHLQRKVNSITKAERFALIKAIKEFNVTVAGTDGFKNAVITRGGISTDEINPKTMESKIVKGLYFAGEIIDVDAYTGGFNLQIAFSTGYLAGKCAAESFNHNKKG